jgi:hypothetical protein
MDYLASGVTETVCGSSCHVPRQFGRQAKEKSVGSHQASTSWPVTELEDLPRSLG